VREDRCRVPFKVKSDEGSVLLLTFNTPLKPGLTTEEVVLETELSVTHTLLLTDLASSYFIYFEFSPTPTTSVTVGVAVKSNLTDLNDVSISQETLQVELSYSKTDMSTSTPEVRSASQITSVALVGAAALGGMFVGSPQSMFLLLNTLQFASLIPLMHFSISEQLSSLLIGNNPFDIIPNLSTLFLKPDWFPEAYSKAKLYGFDSAGFLYNVGKELSVLVGLLLVFLGLFIGSKLECSSSFQRFCSKNFIALKASLIPGYLQGCFQEVLVAVMIQLRSQEYHSKLTGFSCSCAWAFLGFGSVGSLTLVYVAFRSPPMNRFSSFFLGLSSNVLERLRVPGFYVHRLVCVLAITLSYDSLLQGFVCLVLCLLVISSQKFLLLITGTLRLRKFNWSSLVLEASDWLGMVVLLVYSYHPSFESSLKLINLFYSIIFTQLGVSLIACLHQLVVHCRKPRISSLEL
jgi:hypothetical protein